MRRQPAGALPLVVNTWPFTLATQAAWDTLQHGSALDAVEAVRPCCTLQLDVIAATEANRACRAALNARASSATSLWATAARWACARSQHITGARWLTCGFWPAR